VCHLRICPLSHCDVECDGVRKPDLHVLDDHSGRGSPGKNPKFPPTCITETTLMVENKWH
jgi:hypothetical protein